MKKKRTATPQKIRVFVAEDETGLITRLYLGLIRQDFDVEMTDTAEELLDRLLRFQPQVLLISGTLQTAPLCRSIKESLAIPIIVSSDRPADASGLDVDDIVSRPVQLSELGQKIHRLVDQYKTS